MTEQLRAVDHDMHRAAVEAGYAPLTDYVATTTPEVDLLKQVADIVRQAQVEFQGGHAIAGRLEITAAQRLLDRAYRGEGA